ncbi:MAG: hypothetical protein JXA90_16115, partial [Planctomycetes bacterium]|nr:hypothetical protein [Planctomycetota bacterium]
RTSPPASLAAARRSRPPRRPWCLVILLAVLLGAAAAGGGEPGSSWAEALHAERGALWSASAGRPPSREAQRQAAARIEERFPVEWDWALQDGGLDFERWFGRAEAAEIERDMIRKALGELGPAGSDLAERLEALVSSGAPPSDRRWLDLHAEACERRREIRLRPLLLRCRQVLFTRHHNMGGSHYAYTEAQSDAQNERHFHPGASLCILHLEGPRGGVETLIDDPHGVIRDPDVSHDGRRALFSWKKSDRGDDYHLYEMDLETREIRQITSGLGYADYEGAYLPSGDIIFNSTRCVQTVDCWWTEVSNLYTCDRQGGFLRRLTFDQVHTNFPTVMSDGRVIYTRWEYVDRGQVYPQPLFQMNPDGTGQTEFYGNNSWFPTTILHARGIPGSHKAVAILTGHHSRQTGKIAIIDPAKGRQENEGVEEIAPVRETPAVRIDAYGQSGELFQYPYPISETEYLVTYDPYGWARQPVVFAVYFTTIDGRRELLAADPRISSNQPIPIAPRPVPPLMPSRVDYRQETGVFYVQDIHAGPGLAGVPRGSIRKIRVVALRHRPAGIRSNRNHGPAGSALICTPIAIGNGSWDVKVVLGDATVLEDGSACFRVPARTPVYFQAIDASGHMAQTMRSWSTLQPGEHFSCVGCHEAKSDAAAASSRATLAMRRGPQDLEPFHGPPRGFSFRREIQPILDRHCIRCHRDRSRRLDAGPPRAGDAAGGLAGEERPAFSLLGEETPEPHSGRRWSDAYLALTQAAGEPLSGRPNRLVHWISAQSAPPMLPPYDSGAARSGILPLLESGHGSVELTREELDKIACWIDLLVPYCGDYAEASAWTEGEEETYAHFLRKRLRMEALERENITRWIAESAR